MIFSRGLRGSVSPVFAVVVLVTAASVLPAACSLDPERYPGWAGGECDSNAACDDDEPCSIDWCDVWGVCHHDNAEHHVPDDGNECTVDTCKGGIPLHDPAPLLGEACGSKNGKMHCADDARCIGCDQLTGEEDCGGSQFYCQDLACQLKVKVGQPCAGPEMCESGFCGEGICCESDCSAVCFSCSGDETGGADGECLPVLDGHDPRDECVSGFGCNGVGLCGGTLTGEPCSDGLECLTGLCVDGVCCTTSCEGTCRACNLPKALGACVNISLGQDPQDECPGTTACSGNGACKLLPVGAACTMNIECSGGGYCFDGYCCNSACGGTCQACNLAGAIGTCNWIPAGQDPGNECAGALNCNGSGACQ